MKSLDLQAERFTATGNIASEGMRNQLGRPRLDRLTVLVREAVQNAWDAKRDDVDTVTFGVASYVLRGEGLRFLRDRVFARTPGETKRALATLLENGEDVRVLALYDRGTTGLGGPTRADAPTVDGESRDFVDFLRNVGQPPDKDRGGGTFGYGKAALYLSSTVDTILVHTRCQNRGRPESRFMVSALTGHYELAGRSYTGRHWWGVQGHDGVVDPVIGKDADHMAEVLGMPIAPKGEFGTTILLLAPRFDEKSPLQAVSYMQAQMMWNFWPKMIAWDDDDEPRMHFEASLDERRLRMPSPEMVPPLNGFVDALRSVRRGDRGEFQKVDALWCLRPKKKLGLLALRRMVRRPRPDEDYGEDTELPEFVERCHHVALLRRAELVVTYHPGPIFPNDHVEYAGVFFADDGMDRVYAASEPPTHDEWRPENLADANERTFVRTTFRRIDAAIADEVAPVSTSHEVEDDRPLAALASHLGGLLVDSVRGDSESSRSDAATGDPHGAGMPGDVGDGVKGEEGGQNGGSRPVRSGPRPRLEASEDVDLLVEDGVLVRRFRVNLIHSKKKPCTQLEARAVVVLAGGAEERETPEGARSPRVRRWKAPSGSLHGRVNSVLAGAAEEGVWEIDVDGAEGALVALEVVGKAVSDAAG